MYGNNYKFSDTEKACFEFLQLYNPNQLAMLLGEYKGNTVSVLCWLDIEEDKIRPLAIILNDVMVADINLKELGTFEKQADEITPE